MHLCPGSDNLLFAKRTNTKVFVACLFNYAASTFWNSLHIDIKTKSINIFKNKVKNTFQ